MSYQRDLFDTQMDLMDQLHDMREPLFHEVKPKGAEHLARLRAIQDPTPGTLAYKIQIMDQVKALNTRKMKIVHALFDAEDRGRGEQAERIVKELTKRAAGLAAKIKK